MGEEEEEEEEEEEGEEEEAVARHERIMDVILEGEERYEGATDAATRAPAPAADTEAEGGARYELADGGGGGTYGADGRRRGELLLGCSNETLLRRLCPMSCDGCCSCCAKRAEGE